MEVKFPIEVKTNCGKNNLIIKEGKYFLELNAKPKNNEANLELIKFFSKEFKVRVKIIRGARSKMKLIGVV